MDQHALKQLLHLRREIDALAKRKKRLEQRATVITHIIGNMPRESGLKDRVGDYGSELAYLDIMMDNAIARCMHAYREAFGFIESIEDSELRRIMRLRYLDGLTWQKVAYAIGEHDEQYPRRKHDRFLERG